VIVVYGSAREEKAFQDFHKRKHRKKNMEGGVRRELIKWKD
jgi:hypothetical protein